MNVGFLCGHLTLRRPGRLICHLSLFRTFTVIQIPFTWIKWVRYPDQGLLSYKFTHISPILNIFLEFLLLNNLLEVFSSDSIPGVCLNFNPSVPDAPNWRISSSERRFHQTERSQSAADSVKRRAAVFINLSCNICQITRTLTIKKQCHDFHTFHDFSTLRANYARLRGH